LIDAGEDRVVGAFRQTAHGKASGVPVEVEYFQVFELKYGQLIRTCLFLDREEALKAAGLSK
jgi:hypothetical protein